MEQGASPFVTKAIECPICRKATHQRFFRQRLFIPEEKESDQHVARYRWLVDGVQQVNPAFYFLFHCPHCRYTDTTEEYVNPQSNVYTAGVVKLYRRGGQRLPLVELLAKSLDYGAVGFVDALCLHLLAVCIHQLPDTDELRDAYKLGRLYLRIAWLFRERTAQSPARQQAMAHAGAQDRTGAADPALLDVLKAYFTEASKVTESWKPVRARLQERTRILARRPGAVNPYLPLCAAMDEALRAQTAQAVRILEACERDVAGLLACPPRAGEIAASAEDEDAKLQGVLKRLRMLWPDVPHSERAALQKAIALFQRAVSADKRFDTVQSQLSINSLVADLQLRCGDEVGALETVSAMYRSAFTTRAQLQDRLRDPNTPEEDKRRLQGAMARLAESIEQAAELRRELVEKMKGQKAAVKT